MDVTVLIFLSSGLFLGWSLGANDAANVFGTAVGSRMIRFKTAAVICSVFLMLGAVFSGAGAAHGLGKLGAVNALPGSFMVAFTAALTVYWMTKAGLPVSTTQAIVGAIVGWNLFSGSITDMKALLKIVGTWVACPILGGMFSAVIYTVLVRFLAAAKLHLLRLDLYTRWGLILAGAFGSYSLGANNIGNVMGVFVSSSPFTDFPLAGGFTLTSVQQLFLLGSIAIGVGVFTYSKRVMLTVGGSLMPLSPVGAWVVVISHSIVLFLFSSSDLEHLLVSMGLPPIPLIPVSSSQAVIGAVIGIGLLKGRRGVRQIRWRVLLKIGSGWVSTPIIAAVICFVMLFFLQNVFNQQAYRETYFILSEPVLERLEKAGVPVGAFSSLKDEEIAKGFTFREALRELATLEPDSESLVITMAEVYPIHVEANGLVTLDTVYLSEDQIEAVQTLIGKRFTHKWQFHDALSELSDTWKKREANKQNKAHNSRLQEQLEYLDRIFQRIEE